jgi:hypothetical protein
VFAWMALKAATGAVFSWLTGGGGIQALASTYAKYKDSAVESERTKAMLAKAQLDAILSVRLATAGHWEMRVMTFCIAFPFVFHLVSVWLDTQFKLGWRINAFPAPFNEWEGAILLSFFGIQAVGRIAGAIAGRR